MATWNNKSKNSSVFVNGTRQGGNSPTWNESLDIWNDVEGTWDSPRTPFVNGTKNISTFVNGTKN